MKNATVRDNNGKVRFNNAELDHIQQQINIKTKIYFDSLHNEIKDLSANVSESVSNKVVKDVTEVINPAFDKFFTMDKKTNKRINGVIAGVIITFIVFGVVFWIRTDKKEAAHTATYNTEMPHNITSAR